MQGPPQYLFLNYRKQNIQASMSIQGFAAVVSTDIFFSLYCLVTTHIFVDGGLLGVFLTWERQKKREERASNLDSPELTSHKTRQVLDCQIEWSCKLSTTYIQESNFHIPLTPRYPCWYLTESQKLKIKKEQEKKKSKKKEKKTQPHPIPFRPLAPWTPQTPETPKKIKPAKIKTRIRTCSPGETQVPKV